MSKLAEKACWYCGKRGFEPASELGKSWYRCRHCGTTEEAKPTNPDSYIGTAIDIHGQFGTASQHPVRQRGKKMPPLPEKAAQAKHDHRAYGHPIY